MYGLLLQSAVEIIRAKYGQETWEQIKTTLAIDANSFSAFQQYGETLFIRIANLLSQMKSMLIQLLNQIVFLKRRVAIFDFLHVYKARFNFVRGWKVHIDINSSII